MKYKYLLFDWDGCLARTLDVWLYSYKKTLSDLGIKKTDKEITAVFGNWQGGAILGAPDNDKFFEQVDELIGSKMPTIDLYNGVEKTIRKLKKEGYLLAILSSSLRNFLLPAMEYHNILDLFEIVISGEDVTSHKPDPEVINIAIRKLGGQKKDYIMIGDSDKDVLAANNAGIDSLLFYPKEHLIYYDLNKLKKSRPTYLAESFDEIYKRLTQE